MTTPENLVDGVGELFPRGPLALEHRAAFGRQPVEPPAALAGFFRPPPGDEPAGFQPAQHRIERPDAEREPSAGSGFDELADLVAVPRARLEEGEDEQLRAALLQFVMCHGCAA